jgi:UDP-glucose 4-epimerase
LAQDIERLIVRLPQQRADLRDLMPAEKPSCVVLGGGGFMGTNLCRRLLASGHRVRAFGRQCRFSNALHGVEWCQGDFSDSDSVAAAIETFDIVFHLVHEAMPQAADLAIAADVQRTVIPSIILLDLCSKLGVKRVIFSSSGGTVYGCPQQIPTPESAATDPICAYGISKLAIEKYLALYQYLFSLDFRVLRIANPFGPFQVAWKGQGFIAAAISRALSGQQIDIWGDGAIVRDFVFVDDVVDAFEAVMNYSGNKQIFNIGTGEGRSLLEVIAAIETLLDTKLSIKMTPGRSLDIPVSIVAIDRARADLAWAPKTPFETGLATTIEWARRNRPEIDKLFR